MGQKSRYVVTWLKSWEAGLLTHMIKTHPTGPLKTKGTREGEEGTRENGRGPVKIEVDP